MQSKVALKSSAILLLALSYSIYTPCLALVNNNGDYGVGQSASTNSDQVAKRASVILAPKWSLPFQGQLIGAIETTDILQVSDIDQINNSGLINRPEQANIPEQTLILEQTNPPVQTRTQAQSNNTDPGLSEGQSKASKDLALFKQKKVQTLNLTPPETFNNNLISDAGEPDISAPPAIVGENGKFIAGEVSVWDGPFDGDRIVNHLLETHFEHSAEGKKLDAQVKRLGGTVHKSLAVTKDGFEEVLGYQGILPSVRGGQIVLETPNMKMRNVAWAEYARQKYIDKIHAQVVASLMQVAEGIGNSETESGTKSIATGKEELSALVGNEEAERAVKALTVWLNNTQVSYATFAQTPWTTSERNKKLEAVLISAVEHDPVITEVTKRVMKYSNPGKLALASSQVIQTVLNGITVFSPGFIPSISSGALQVAYKLSTGGTEQNKLERELLFDKRIQSRLKVLTQESSMALDNYRFALVTKNPPLLAFSQEVLENLTGSDKTGVLLSSADHPSEDYDSTNKIVPEMVDGKKENPKSKVNFVVKNLGQMTVTDFKKYDE